MEQHYGSSRMAAKKEINAFAHIGGRDPGGRCKHPLGETGPGRPMAIRVSLAEILEGQRQAAGWVRRFRGAWHIGATAHCAGFGCAFSHSSLPTFLVSWTNTNVPFLLPTTMSGFLSPVKSPATTCVPTPESLSIRYGTKSTVLSVLRTSLNQ